jgi:hypothetical protein
MASADDCTPAKVAAVTPRSLSAKLSNAVRRIFALEKDVRQLQDISTIIKPPKEMRSIYQEASGQAYLYLDTGNA